MGKERSLSGLFEVLRDAPKVSTAASPEYVNTGQSCTPPELPTHPDCSSSIMSSDKFIGGSLKIGGIDIFILTHVL
jgi:hypothetical protein